MRVALVSAFLCICAGRVDIALAQSQPSRIVTGESSVIVEGAGAAVTGDATSDGKVVTGGSSNVFIGGKPAATAGSGTDCGGAVVTGTSTVFVNGKPLATSGSVVAGAMNGGCGGN
ncbi:MAG: PAAR domain-containing protein [Pseudomonadota bacterium]|nr:PAAR domain-containing protein [Pseudomonadota bacterium]